MTVKNPANDSTRSVLEAIQGASTTKQPKTVVEETVIDNTKIDEKQKSIEEYAHTLKNVLGLGKSGSSNKLGS